MAVTPRQLQEQHPSYPHIRLDPPVEKCGLILIWHIVHWSFPAFHQRRTLCQQNPLLDIVNDPTRA